MSFEVFISHASDDEEIALVLKDLLERLFPGIDVFVSGNDLRGGFVWPAALADHLKQAGVILALITRESRENLWIHFEAGAGVIGERTIPVCADGVSKGDLRPPLGLLQARYLEASDLKALIRDIALKASQRDVSEERHVINLIASCTQRVDQVLSDRARAMESVSPGSVPPSSFGEKAQEVESAISIDVVNYDYVEEAGGYQLLMIDITLENRSSQGYTVTQTRWRWNPEEILGLPVSRHLESEDIECFGFQVPSTRISLHHKRPLTTLWTYPKDLLPGETIPGLVAIGVRRKLDAPSNVAREGFLVTVNVLNSMNQALGSLSRRFPLPESNQRSQLGVMDSGGRAGTGP